MPILDHINLNNTRYDIQDTKSQAMLAPTEASSTASAAHAKGSYFIYGGVLYVATADIDSGGTITPNTNCVAATVGGEVSDLKSALKNMKQEICGDLGDVKNVIGIAEKISALDEFEHGSINSSTGAYDSSGYAYRCATPEKATLGIDYTVTIASGFRLYVFFFDASGNKISSGWNTGTITLAKDSIIRMIIARETENTSETADIEEFCSKVSCVLKENLQSVISEMDNAIDETDSNIQKIYDGDIVTTIGVNKLNPDEAVTEKSLSPTGALIDRSGYRTTGFIRLDTDKTSIVLSGMNAAGTNRVGLPTDRICFYNDSESFLSNVDSVSSNTVTPIPENASYARISYNGTTYESRSPMVEFVDSISGISSTFVEYGEITTGYKGIYGLNDDISDLNDDMSDLNDDMSDLNDDMSVIGDTIKDIYGNPSAISNLYVFEQGGIQSNGDFRSDWKYRAATPAIHNVTSDFTITIASGYRVYVVTYDMDDTFISASWVTAPYTIRNGQRVRLCIAKVTEDKNVRANVETFCSNVTYVFAQSIFNVGNKASGNICYGVTWDWWISANSIDKFGNVYIGYVDTEEYAGVLRRQPDGTMQYKQLEKSFNDDDHNGMATIVLDDGRILVIGAQSHAQNNKMICYRSKQPYSIDEMEKLSFEIPQGNEYIYRVTYSQVFKYNGKLFDFCRCGSYGETTTLGYACLVSEDNGSSWTAYKAITANDPYATLRVASDDPKIIKGVIGHNPSTRPVAMLKGFTFDMSTNEFANLAGTKIGELVALNSGSMADNDTAHYADMTDLVSQGESSKSCRLFYVGRVPKANTNFLYAIAEDSTNDDWVYKLYKNGTVIDIGHSGVPFGTGIYICGACFGIDADTVYYAKATTADADGNHELHKVKITGSSVASDTVIMEASVSVIRPLFLGNGEVAVVIGHYNDQTENGYNGSFTEWELKPMFVHA